MNKKKDTESASGIIESWIIEYTNNLYSWAFFKTSNKESAEDLVQDTFLTAHEQFAKFRGESTPKTWLLAILNNKIRAYYRKKYRQLAEKERSETSNSSIFGQLFDENGRWKNKEKPLAWHGDQGHLLDNVEFNSVLKSCLDKLPEHWQVAVNLKYIEQKKGDVICQELDIAPTNFWQVLHRAKLQLRKCLEINWFKV